ncbi:transposase [Moorena sp. SIO4A5]|uniref:REP-associated tyrosine transposase n=1 Tax=Moorena sp. SIO4A5 TaxID=2607838 RepID=UPI0013C7E5DE|nr:transposase [Moorena sp. SIO4A5]NEO19284.1 transposase [Moorena sp. SIO4A5]
MQYRRAKTPGATYFFTVVTHNRRKILCELENVDLLRNAFRAIRQQHHFKIDAIVVLPDHLHSVWTLPENDADFSTRWRLIKSYFSRQCNPQYEGNSSTSRQHKGEKAVWQRRFWEHQIRDERDFINHLEYIHYNPVHHGLVTSPKDWQYSSFHRYVEAGIYDREWGSSERLMFDSQIGRE